jgi:hypothetical protein
MIKKKKKASKVKAKAKAGPKEKTAILRLDVAFYPQAALKQAKEAFAHLASIEIRRQGRQRVIKFGGMSAAAARKLPDEFANYALSCAVVEA